MRAAQNRWVSASSLRVLLTALAAFLAVLILYLDAGAVRGSCSVPPVAYPAPSTPAPSTTAAIAIPTACSFLSFPPLLGFPSCLGVLPSP
jgi:hypothetical protein